MSISLNTAKKYAIAGSSFGLAFTFITTVIDALWKSFSSGAVWLLDASQLGAAGSILGALATTALVIFAGKQLNALVKQIVSSDNQARLRATVDLAMEERNDSVFRQAKEVYSRMRDNEENFTALACEFTKSKKQLSKANINTIHSHKSIAFSIDKVTISGSEVGSKFFSSQAEQHKIAAIGGMDAEVNVFKNMQILYILNHYEFLAIGIKHGAFDEEIYKRMNKSTFVRDWKALAPYIEEFIRQDGNKKIFCEFRELALKWESES